MKRRITAVVAAILVCCAVYLLMPYAPMPDAEEIAQVQVFCVYIGDTAVDITDKVDTDAVRELLPQVRARRFPNRWHGMRESGGIPIRDSGALWGKGTVPQYRRRKLCV